MDESRATQLGRKAAQIAGRTFFAVIPPRVGAGEWCIRFDDNSYEARISPGHKDSDEEVVAEILRNMKPASD